VVERSAEPLADLDLPRLMAEPRITAGGDGSAGDGGRCGGIASTDLLAHGVGIVAHGVLIEWVVSTLT
jgi:hypothetical protein